MKYMFNIVMCQDTCKLICFKLDMMLNNVKVYSLIAVWKALMFTQGQGYGKARTCAVSVLKDCRRELNCTWWFPMWGGWLWNPVSMGNMDHGAFVLLVCFVFLFLWISFKSWIPALLNLWSTLRLSSAFPSCISGAHHFRWDFCVCACFLFFCFF